MPITSNTCTILFLNVFQDVFLFQLSNILAKRLNELFENSAHPLPSIFQLNVMTEKKGKPLMDFADKNSPVQD